ncbi:MULTISPECIES: 2Fe-2S iron-sulfur cluster-binding protein [Paenibacillus]|uniref:2Fe-2S iron-sulfur cluster-binding protein n=1 Tax=Paenibacillus TaxID=44249 RepID=UPI0011EB9468|nr:MULTISPECIES: 2Fe-2S iron-sulfur cluster-binding protein [Paenibacillus]MBE0335895.1 2Fe-2S iron-sulfur cluster binding domain-containing protein [Paenibacillus sp. 23TSA30-6]
MDVHITFKPSGRRVQVGQGTTLLQAARKANVYIPTRCDGKAACLMCKVHISQERAVHAGQPSDAERRKLGPLLDEGIRLSCQARAQSDVEVTIPEDRLKAAVRRQLERQAQEDELW